MIPRLQPIFKRTAQWRANRFREHPVRRQREAHDPQAGLAFDLEGTDSGNLGEPAAPSVSSQERADEAVENYWMALLRDVAFTNYATDPNVAQACAELYPTLGLSRTTDQRASHSTDLIPRIHRRRRGRSIRLAVPAANRLLRRASHGAAISPIAGLDYMTDFGSWLTVQNGQGPFPEPNVFDPQLRYLRDGRESRPLSTSIFSIRPISWPCCGC